MSIADQKRAKSLVSTLLFIALTFCAHFGHSAAPSIHVIRIENSINPASAVKLSNRIQFARSRGAQALVIELDTPGGLESSMRSMVKDILNSPVPVIVYVSPSGARAASAGAVITLSAHVAAMAPGTNIGAAHPVNIGGKGDEILLKKAENDLAAFARSIAQQRYRNADWAEAAVRQSSSITETEALRLGVIDLVARDLKELLGRLNGRELQIEGRKIILSTHQAPVERYDESFFDRTLVLLADPNISYLFFILGIAGIYFELVHPGAMFPGVIGAISLLLALYGFQTISVSFSGILLIILAALLFLLEVKTPAHGILGFGGIVALFLGSIMVLSSGGQSPSLEVLLPVVITAAAFFMITAYLAARASAMKPKTGGTAMIGDIGTVLKWSGRHGTILVHGEYWDATSEEELPAGTQVLIESINRLSLRVRKMDS